LFRATDACTVNGLRGIGAPDCSHGSMRPSSGRQHDRSHNIRVGEDLRPASAAAILLSTALSL
jgi:hypothetical protein